MNATRWTCRLACLALLVTGAALAGGDWNDGGIAWTPYEEGLAAAAKQNKPICLVFYTDTCPHCTTYSAVFHDPKVVAASKDFVMIRLNKHENTELSAQYAPDGEYIPRTYFLSSAGELDATIQTPRDKYFYFYSTSDPESLLDGMSRAQAKLASSGS